MNRYRFHCQLATMENKNNFTEELFPFLNDAHQFCSQINLLTNGAIKYDSSLQMLPQKRLSGNDGSASKAKKKKVDNKDELDSIQEEISRNEIGILHILAQMFPV